MIMLNITRILQANLGRIAGRLHTRNFSLGKLQTGIVGLPNVGKSTLFNALVGSEAAQAANFPFCTIGDYPVSHYDYCCTWLNTRCSYDEYPTALMVMLIVLHYLEPNVGIVNVPDGRLQKLRVLNESVKIVPTSVGLLHSILQWCLTQQSRTQLVIASM